MSEGFAQALKRITQKRLHYCSHQTWLWDRLICVGCWHTAQEIGGPS